MTHLQIISSLVPSVSRREKISIMRMVSAFLSQWPERTRGSPPVPNYLRRDVGLMPEEPRRTYWDHQ
ncbi:MAG TPA: hypothetical protein VG757_09115 [Devosia sp.]|nr:hypothetical protein [Devosia sp.]